MTKPKDRDLPDHASEILDAYVGPRPRVRLGSLLAGIGRRAKLTDEQFAVFAQLRYKAPSHHVNVLKAQKRRTQQHVEKPSRTWPN